MSLLLLIKTRGRVSAEMAPSSTRKLFVALYRILNGYSFLEMVLQHCLNDLSYLEIKYQETGKYNGKGTCGLGIEQTSREPGM